MKRNPYRLFNTCTLTLVLFCLSSPVKANETKLSTFKSQIQPFLQKYCVDCHDDETQKGDIALHEIKGITYGNADLWSQILEQVSLKEMPPRKKKNQPNLMERDQFSKAITGELIKAHKGKGAYKTHLHPHKANYLDHDLLFNTTHKNLSPASTPARIWRIHPLAHLVRLSELIATQPPYDPAAPGKYTRGDRPVPDVNGVLKVQLGLERFDYKRSKAGRDSLHFNRHSHGFTPILAISQAHGLRDYAQLRGVNGAEAMQVIEEAEKILHFMAYGPESIKYIEGKGQVLTIKYAKEIKRPLTPVYDLMNKEGVSEFRLIAAINYLFEKLTLRKPTKNETTFYLEIANESIRKLGKKKGALSALAVIFNNHHAFYHRQLANYGTPDKYGRVMLQGQELVLTINHAFCDLMPDDRLHQALREGKLTSRTDVKREVKRILNDDSIRKPRMLQFFREYFDYGDAAAVFKDADIVKGIQSYYIGNTRDGFNQGMVNQVANTDRLVELILQEDKDVLKELLTTDRVIYDDRSAILYRNIDNKRWFIPPYTFYRGGGSFGRSPLLKAKDGNTIPVMHHWKGYKSKKAKKNIEAYERTKQAYTKRRNELMNDVFPGIEKPIYVRLSKVYYHGVQDFGSSGDVHSRTLTRLNKSQRMGILTHPSWLVAHSNNTDNHVIHRGKWIRERLLGDAVPDVPINVDAKLPLEKATLRHRMRVTREEECWRCHKKMDPLGLPFEMYNHLGMYREKERGKPVDASGEIFFSGDPKLDGPVTNALDMIQKLANSERVEQVFIRHVFRFWMGRNETLNDAPILQAAHKAYKESGGSMKALLTSLLTSDAFLYRKVDRK